MKGLESVAYGIVSVFSSPQQQGVNVCWAEFCNFDFSCDSALLLLELGHSFEGSKISGLPSLPAANSGKDKI